MKRYVAAICASGTLLALVAIAMGQPGPGQVQVPVVESRAAAGYQKEYLIRLQPAADDPERKVNSLVHKWKSAEGDEARGQAEGELRAALTESFEFRLKRHEEQVQQLEERVKQLREQLDRRREKQAEIIDFRLQQLLREAQGLGWGAEAALPSQRAIVDTYLDSGYPRSVPAAPAPARDTTPNASRR